MASNAGWLTNTKVESLRKEGIWLIFMSYPPVSLRNWWNVPELPQYIQSPCRDVKPGYSENHRGVLTARPSRAVKLHDISWGRFPRTAMIIHSVQWWHCSHSTGLFSIKTTLPPRDQTDMSLSGEVQFWRCSLDTHCGPQPGRQNTAGTGSM
jgi:hypothetical protein